MKKLAVYVASIGVVLSVSVYMFLNDQSSSKKTNVDKANATVKVVNLAQNSGGTGVILASHDSESVILTNNHVCEVAKHGGFVVLDNQTKYPVMGYRQSNLHDLCLISVAADLKVNTSVARRSPALYEEAVIAGHPALLPTIITKGHFSGKILGQILIGKKECDATITDPKEIIMCLIMGGIPIIKNFEMQVVSATIQPGSSGSAVYDANGDLAGLVFAGSGDIGYGLIVPYEYILNFLRNELPNLPLKFPSGSDDADEARERVRTTKIRKICKLKIFPALAPICELINRSTLYVQ